MPITVKFLEEKIDMPSIDLNNIASGFDLDKVYINIDKCSAVIFQCSCALGSNVLSFFILVSFLVSSVLRFPPFPNFGAGF